ncbi:hypothetical protein HETIRDRAFT_439710 [Heterobasidion irregulare TC 32-1]|uniref:Uncharacterized protein n=1 Tax=Heterobasidion irregulare (strain TC 32-1) TaxID=747525 RepID=W4KBP3_HETIT|nr:uncharacterized protein HETIRDRAFT_439710 [Heterobasidion irregulare TC 32-1]ETW83267.1 hypothetical protein HETIRDRAFT_439710 [Heterobasidion irregulare TC 32-1]
MASTIDQLKSEGNALFGQKQYEAALEKYGEAINLDDRNAILYSNRAACQLALADYTKAMEDAEHALKLDPVYSKAWARLASAQGSLNLLPHAIKSWQSAIDSLPKKDLKPADVKQRTQYLDSLEAMKLRERIATQEKLHLSVPHRPSNGGKKLSWDRAQELLPELRKAGKMRSSAWVLAVADEQYSKGARVLKQVVQTGDPKGPEYFGVLKEMSNAVLQDKRCFRIDGNDWFDKWNWQMKLEALRFRTPNPDAPLKEVDDHMQNLLAEGGWDLARPSIEFLVRFLFMKAVLDGDSKLDNKASLETYDQVLAILHWGRERWSDVPATDRGVVFDDTFVRGVRSMRIHEHMRAWELDNDSKLYTLDGLLEEANSIIDEIQNSPRENVGTPFDMAHYDYIEGKAIALKGFYYREAPFHKKMTDKVEIEDFYDRSFKYYLEAADKFPEDDEYHIVWLNNALDVLTSGGTTLRQCMPIFNRIRSALPEVTKIWDDLLTTPDQNKNIVPTLLAIVEAEEKIAAGSLTLDSYIVPERFLEGKFGLYRGSRPYENPLSSGR